MAMDAGTIAAVVALVVSILAMFVACAQAIQQYVITGQLIRICDGVVYGKMPGQGRRVWEFSQFRFRVVYSMPQVGLRPSLWFDILPQHHSDSKGHLPLPDLRHTAHRQGSNSFSYAFGHVPRRQMRSEYSATPGEASWVSFCRVAQHASESDLFYDLIDSDADRCPSDLPAVPMQVSLRDIAVIAIMAGMRCTYASFEKKSLSMTGAVGTITSSWHPILGATIHFAPRNYSALSDSDARMDEVLGLRIGSGSISSKWMARMADVIIVAGRHYDAHDRLSYEEFEGHTWVTLSRSRAMVKASTYSPLRQTHSPVRTFRLRSISPIRGSRSRGRSRASTRSRSLQSVVSRTDGPIVLRPVATTEIAEGFTEVGIRPSKNDGDWAFESEISASTSDSGGITQRENVPQHLYQKQENTAPPRDSSHKRAMAYLRTPFRSIHAMMSRHNPTADLENDGMTGISMMTTAQAQRTGNLQPVKHERRRSTSVPTKPEPQQSRADHSGGRYQPPRLVRRGLDGQVLQDYIAEKRQHPGDTVFTVNGRLLLTWRSDADSSSDLLGQFGEAEGWVRSANQLHQDRVLFAIQKWRTMVEKRRQLREEPSGQDDWEVESLETYRSSPVPSSRATTPASRRDSRSGSRERRTGQSNGALTPGQNLGPEARGRVRTPKGVAESRYQSPSPLSARRFRRRNSDGGSLPDQVRRVAYGDEPIDPIEDVDGTGPSEGKSENKGGTPTRVVENQNDPKDGEEATDPKRPRSTSKNQQLRKPRRVQIILPEHANDPEPEIASITTASNASERESSTERTRPGVGPLKRGDIQDGEQPRVAGNVETRRVSDEAQLGKENIPPTPAPAKPILKPPTRHFPEDENPIREGVAPLRHPIEEGIPAGARWTKINRRLVNPEALEKGHERFEERDDYVVVLRVLSRQEIIKYAELTREIREAREQQRDADKMTESPASMSDSEDDHNDNQATNEPKDAAAQQGRRTSPSSSRLSHSPETNSATPAVSIPPTPISDRNSFSSQTGPRRRRASTQSDISVGESLESESQDLRRTRSRSTGRRSIFGDESGTGFDTKPGAEERPSQGLVDWFWLSQADVLPGYCATPWQGNFSESTCFGAIMTMLVALEYYYADESTLLYVEKQAHCEEWIRQGRSTYPSYAINAMGGVVVSRKYPRVKFECLSAKIPPIELLDSYRYQVNRSGFEGSSRSVVERLGELMCLDSWLSICGRLPEIYDGGNDLLRSTPALVQKIMTDFDFEFSRLKRTPAEGGLQLIKEMAESIVHTLEKESLSEAEQLFAVVAILRTAKMALCVIYGPGTAQLRDILVNDVQVYLV
ncbi:uncharacterized protein Z520_09142 [Fonsecaea multimorphosa CBS 102226]|uniref:DUF8035 domain-containing protein n=1 Tax=Fonsecaea multimorphosa CBS 102226 TaxID=1442371 RepID=A0A0D2H076_9EURO|nr:uncharacterized protein Z520_09142 [Fonsecaea multimorphosa CBS 102226]KIX95225.1 hypothetical protein Z520_09142 [Fonsecaea multimorphosa CBS 102226]